MILNWLLPRRNIKRPTFYVAPHQQDSHMLATFPEAKGYVTKRIKEMKRGLNTLPDMEWEIESQKIPHVEKLQLFFNTTDKLRHYYESNIERLESMIAHSAFPESDIGNIDLDIVRAIRCTDLMSFNKAGFARCFLHNDKTPSLHYIAESNKVYCFSCNFKADVIDLYKALNNCDFKTAISKLSPGTQ